MTSIDVQVKGFNIYCANDIGELYDFFLPKDHYRMSKTEAHEHIPENHKLIDFKRDSKTYRVIYEDLQDISQKL